MDRVELTTADVERLIVWRDAHKDGVRSAPCPLKAVEIRILDNGWTVKGIRDGDILRLHLNHSGQSLGSCEFKRLSNKMWASVRNRMQVNREGVQSCLTVYLSLMALMTYGRVETEPREVRQTKPHKARQSSPKPTKQPRVTYILREVNGRLTAAPRGSHASPRGEFNVRGHYRHYKSGKVVWIAEYRKGTGGRKRKTYKMGGPHGKAEDAEADHQGHASDRL